MIPETDLILNPDGSIYHLNLLPEDVAETIITVGDPDRVEAVSKYFDRIELRKGKREFITHTGYVGNQRVTVISTGIGTDNIDIVLNELDALVNVDFRSRLPKSEHTSLNIIRIGTSGSVQPDIPMDSLLVSAYGVGLDALVNYYHRSPDADEAEMEESLAIHFSTLGINPYVTAAGNQLLRQLAYDISQGITVTAPGFYAPQGRQVRAKQAHPHLLEQITAFRHNHLRITNLEMETAGIYALAKVLGHQAISVNAILASRLDDRFSKAPQKIVDRAIRMVLERISTKML